MRRRAIVLLLLMVGPAAVVAGQSSAPGRLTGQVVDQAGRPVADAAVSLSGAPPWTRTTVHTDRAGAFSFDNLPAGSFHLSALADGHGRAVYGAQRPGSPIGMMIRLAPGQQTSDLRLVVEQHGAISGRILDYSGEPAATRVSVYSVEWASSGLRLGFAGGRKSSEDGRYVVDGLLPGSYVVRAGRLGGSTSSLALPEGHVPVDTFYPGVPVAERAGHVVVTAGSESRGIDIRVTSSAQSGIVVSLLGSGRFSDIKITVLSLDDSGAPRFNMRLGWPSKSSQLEPGTTGFWAPAGRYRVLVSGQRDDEQWWSSNVVVSNGMTPVRVDAVMSPAATVSGRVVFDRDVEDTAYPRIRLRSTVDDPGHPDFREFAALADDTGEFEIADVAPGTYVIEVDSPSRTADWRPSAITVDGRDVVGLPVEVMHGQFVRGVEVTVSDRMSVVRGVALNADGRPRLDVSLVAFPADGRYWVPDSQRIKSARPDTTGVFVFLGLPAGEYLIASTTEPVPLVPDEPHFLARLAASATLVEVTWGDLVDVTVRVR